MATMTESKTPTPRTDNAWVGRMIEPSNIPMQHLEFDVVRADFARQLETELTLALAKIEELEKPQSFCGECDGTGLFKITGTDTQACAPCNGTGKTTWEHSKAQHNTLMEQLTLAHADIKRKDEALNLSLDNLRHLVSVLRTRNNICPDARFAINAVKNALSKEVTTIQSTLSLTQSTTKETKI